MKKEDILKVLDGIPAPESGTGLVKSGLVKNVQLFGKQVDIDLLVFTPALHVRKKLEGDVERAIREAFGQDVEVKISTEVRKIETAAATIKGDPLAHIQNVIAIASGKGGVGKSTVTANLAVALADMGFKVGLVDADIYGPSMPIMFDVLRARPHSVQRDGQSKIEPIESYGVKLLSIGFFADPDQAVVWRGPMASSAMSQLLEKTLWGDLDILLVDMPPGTGDIQLTLAQRTTLSGAVIVTTPQDIALLDARKGIEMFQKVDVPVLGLIENMAAYVCTACGHVEPLFGEQGGEALAGQYGVPLLGQIPLDRAIRECADAGQPIVVVEPDGAIAGVYQQAATAIMASLGQHQPAQAPVISMGD